MTVPIDKIKPGVFLKQTVRTHNGQTDIYIDQVIEIESTGKVILKHIKHTYHKQYPEDETDAPGTTLIENIEILSESEDISLYAEIEGLEI